jgi:adenylate cyclase
MGIEIERKFLVRNADWRGQPRPSERLSQGYLSRADDERVEIRIRCAGSRSFITVKGKGGLTRSEFKYEIPYDDAQKMLQGFCSPLLVEKVRHEIEHGGMKWYVDEFLGAHAGLVLAEVELTDANQGIDLPLWIGKEVTENPTYRNANLAANPQAWYQK